MSERKKELEVVDPVSQEREFQRWWKASKYCQVIFPNPHLEQYARDGFAAGHAQATRLLSEKDAEIADVTFERDNWMKSASAMVGMINDREVLIERLTRERCEALRAQTAQKENAGWWHARAHVAEAEVARLLALMRTAHAVMRECGWHLAAAAEPNGDGVLEMACTEVEADFAEALSSYE